MSRSAAPLFLGFSAVLALASCTGPNPAYNRDKPGAPSVGDAGSASPPDTPSIGDAGYASPPDAPSLGDLGSASPPEAPSLGDAGAASPPDAPSLGDLGSASPPDAPSLGDAGAASPPDGPSLGDVAAAADPPVAIDGGVSAALGNGLVGFWTMDESSNALVARDRSGGGNHGALEGFAAGRAWVAGRRSGAALQVTGAGNPQVGVRIEASAAIRAIQSFTIAAWIYIDDDSLADWRTILSREIDATDNETFNLTVVRGHIKILTASSPTNMTAYAYSATSPQLAPKNRWLHVAATLGGGFLRVYEDGVETNNTGYDHPLPASNAPLYIGTNKNTAASGNEPFAGLIDDLLLWNVALTAAQIRDLAAGMLPPQAP
jgi:hypothetical protein